MVVVWQCSEYTRVLNMLLVLNMLGFWIYLSWNIRKTFFKKIWESSVSWKLEILFWEKYKKPFLSRFFRKKYQKFFRKKFWRLRPKSALGSWILYYWGLGKPCGTLLVRESYQKSSIHLGEDLVHVWFCYKIAEMHSLCIQ